MTLIKSHFIFSLALLALTQLARGFTFSQLLAADIKVKAPLPDLYEATIAELQAGLDAGHFTSVDLVKVRFADHILILFTCDLSFWNYRHILLASKRSIYKAQNFVLS